MIESNYKRIFILLTTNCNLHCQYCFELGKHQSVITTPTIKRILRKEISNTNIQYIITFHGGEPFLEFEMIKETVEWARLTFKGYHIRFDVSTNGTILTDEIKSWLINNQELFTVSISLDGKRDVHNAMRCNSFDRIDLAFFQSLRHVKAKMTVSPLFISEMFSNYLYLSNMGFEVAPSIAQEVDWDESKYLHLYTEQMGLFVNYLLVHPEIGLPPFFRYDIGKLSEKRRQNRSLRGCPVYFNSVGYDVNGVRYPCNGFLNNFQKNNSTGEIEHLCQLLSTIPDEDLLTTCKDCVIRNVCSTCYGMNYVYRGAIEKVNTQLCPYLINTVYAVATLWAKAIDSNTKYVWMREKTDNDIINIIEGIKFLYSQK